MCFSTWQSSRRVGCITMLGVVALLLPAVARAQYSAPDLSNGAIGEKYHVEVAGTLWNPNLFGQISSEQFGIVGTKIDFLSDLGYTQTRFKDLRIVLRPTRKARFRIEYLPIQYTSQTTFKRNVVFNGIKFPLSVPIESTFAWKVWRLGYEYDFLYKPRGFVGVLLEGRFTQMDARLKTLSPIFSPPLQEFATAKAPLPAIGVVGRGYVLPDVAIDFELSGMHLPADVIKGYEARYFDWDLHGTVNLSNNFGVQVGWRKVTNYLVIKKDLGDLRFQGIWFGAAVRY